MAQPYLSIIIPAYNEAERLPKTLVQMDKALADAEFTYEILVSDNGSRDETRAIVRNMEKVVRNLKLVDGKTGGKGIAVREGMLAAQGRVRLFTDADDSTPIGEFAKMMPYFKEGYDVVIGSRAVRGAVLDPPEPFYRQIAGKAINIVVQLLLLPGLWDTQCGFKAFTADAAIRVFSRSKIPGWAFDVEILSLARKMGYRIKEMPVHWINDTRSHVKFAAGFQFLGEALKVRWWLWRGSYPLAALDTRPGLG
jgi:dolichyl-phosphate beta-glucosyltransferase